MLQVVKHKNFTRGITIVCKSSRPGYDYDNAGNSPNKILHGVTTQVLVSRRTTVQQLDSGVAWIKLRNYRDPHRRNPMYNPTMDVIPCGDQPLAHCASFQVAESLKAILGCYLTLVPKVSFCDEKLVIVQRKTGLYRCPEPQPGPCRRQRKGRG